MNLSNFLKPSQLKRVSFFLILDILLSFFTLFLAYNLRFSFEVPFLFYEKITTIFLLIIVLKLVFLNYVKVYKVAWRYFSLNEASKLLKAHIYTYFAFFIIFLLFEDVFSPFARSILIIDFVLSFVSLGALRFSKRIILESGNKKSDKATLIIGASSFAQTVINNKKEFNIVSIIDNDKMMIKSYFCGLKVYSLSELEDIVESENIESVIIAKKFGQNRLNSIILRLKKLKVNDIKIYSLDKQDQLKDLSVEDLLARYPKDLDKILIENFVKQKRVLITGAGGSIGSEIARQCVKYGAKDLILLDHSEFNLYAIAEEIATYSPILVMQSVVNKEFLEKTFQKHKPDIVIHAAAYKHVPLVQENIQESIINNIVGTKNVIDCSIAHNVLKVVLISTDKAVRPTNVMGTTKRVCELYAQNVASNTTEIVSVRFGNVLGSSGSVIPKFRAQIQLGGPITVTHPDITRYFMLIPEACELVLQTAAIAKGGELFILDMGEPVKIVDLAKKMIEISGKEGIEIVFTGLRAGEKLYEELLIEQSDKKTQYDSITVAKPTFYDINQLNNDIENLLKSKTPLKELKKIVPEFNHQVN